MYIVNKNIHNEALLALPENVIRYFKLRGLQSENVIYVLSCFSTNGIMQNSKQYVRVEAFCETGSFYYRLHLQSIMPSRVSYKIIALLFQIKRYLAIVFTINAHNTCYTNFVLLITDSVAKWLNFVEKSVIYNAYFYGRILVKSVWDFTSELLGTNQYKAPIYSGYITSDRDHYMTLGNDCRVKVVLHSMVLLMARVA